MAVSDRKSVFLVTRVERHQENEEGLEVRKKAKEGREKNKAG